MKSLFVYAFYSILIGGGYLLALLLIPLMSTAVGLPHFTILLSILILFLFSLRLGIVHFIPKFRHKSPSPFLSLVLGAAWLSLSLLFLLIAASWMGFYLSVPESMLHVVWPMFFLYYHIPFFLIWLLLSILISASLMAKKPFWLVERKAKYIQILGVLLCLYIIIGIRQYQAGREGGRVMLQMHYYYFEK